MKQLTLILLLIGLWSCIGQTQNEESNAIATEVKKLIASPTQIEIKGLDSVYIDFQFRGNCYAYSSYKNAELSNGEAHSDNLPKSVDKSFSRKGLYLFINQNEFSKIDSSALGCKLYLINTTNDLIKLEASDSRLEIIAEALNEKFEWVPISYLPSSDCGNSYHTVLFDKNEYWSFDIPIFKGEIKTKLRYTLRLDKDHKISSNEIVAYLNKGQFDSEKKEDYISSDIMDPYDE